MLTARAVKTRKFDGIKVVAYGSLKAGESAVVHECGLHRHVAEAARATSGISFLKVMSGGLLEARGERQRERAERREVERIHLIGQTRPCLPARYAHFGVVT